MIEPARLHSHGRTWWWAPATTTAGRAPCTCCTCKRAPVPSEPGPSSRPARAASRKPSTPTTTWVAPSPCWAVRGGGPSLRDRVRLAACVPNHFSSSGSVRSPGAGQRTSAHAAATSRVSPNPPPPPSCRPGQQRRVGSGGRRHGVLPEQLQAHDPRRYARHCVGLSVSRPVCSRSRGRAFPPMDGRAVDRS